MPFPVSSSETRLDWNLPPVRLGNVRRRCWKDLGYSAEEIAEIAGRD